MNEDKVVTRPQVPVEEAAYLESLLFTDTVVYQVMGRTAKTLTLRDTREGDVAKSENRDGNPYPVVWTYAEDFPESERTFTVRLRKDGTYRIADWAHPLQPARMIDGRPVAFTDYRY